MARIVLLLLTVLTIAISIFASSASAQSLSEAAITYAPWLSIALTAAFAIVLYVAMNWGDKREPYKI